MPTLYEFPPTRSQRARWVLEELQINYTSKVVDLPGGEQDQPDYRKLHPLGVVPTLATESYTIFESAAIVLQLLDEHPQSGLAPVPGSAERALYYQWCVFAAAEIDPPVMMVFDNTLRPLEAMRPAGATHNAVLAQRGRDDFALRAAALTTALDNRSWLLGETFTGADIMVGHSCFMAELTGLIGDWPRLQDYLKLLQQRPAYQRAYQGL